jgi:ABC-2 type transport system permease protein
MAQEYSQFRAMMAVTKASLIATFKSPQSVFFSLFFPVVLIWIFGSLGRGGTASVDVAWEKNTDTLNNELYDTLKSSPFLHFINSKNKDIEDELNKGRIAAIIGISRNGDTAKHSRYKSALGLLLQASAIFKLLPLQ